MKMPNEPETPILQLASAAGRLCGLAIVGAVVGGLLIDAGGFVVTGSVCLLASAALAIAGIKLTREVRILAPVIAAKDEEIAKLGADLVDEVSRCNRLKHRISGYEQTTGDLCRKCHWRGVRGNGCDFCALTAARAENASLRAQLAKYEQGEK
jgi:7-cyano-7-deazaguanine synthase in queuosine biosynthesis